LSHKFRVDKLYFKLAKHIGVINLIEGASQAGYYNFTAKLNKIPMLFFPPLSLK